MCEIWIRIPLGENGKILYKSLEKFLYVDGPYFCREFGKKKKKMKSYCEKITSSLSFSCFLTLLNFKT